MNSQAQNPGISPGKVDIFAYDDPRKFLQANLQERRSRGLSLRDLATRSGFSNPSTLSMILSGKRKFTSKTAMKVAKGLRLQGRHKTYFLTLSLLDQADSVQEKNKLDATLVKLRSQKSQTKLELSQFRFLATWYYPVLYVMIGWQRFQNEPTWIANQLNQSLSQQQISTALNDLEKLGLIEYIDNKWRQTGNTVTTGDRITSPAMLEYHRKMATLGAEALVLPRSQREFHGMTIPMSAATYEKIKARLIEFRTELSELLSEETDEESVYQINLQFFPLTKTNEKKTGEEK